MHLRKGRGEAKQPACPSTTWPPRLGKATRPPACCILHSEAGTQAHPIASPKAPVSMATSPDFLKMQAAEMLWGSALGQGPMRLHNEFQRLVWPFPKARCSSTGNVRCYSGGRMCLNRTLNRTLPTLQGKLTRGSGLTTPPPRCTSARENT